MRGLLMGLLGLIASFVLRILAFTLRVKEVPEGLREKLIFGDKALIVAFWHAEMLLPAYLGQGANIHVLIGQHTDAEYIARTVEWMGYKAVRGSTTRGGARAVLEMIGKAKGGCKLAVTPDGPRGPRHSVQPGVIFLAQKTGFPIYPLSVAFSSCWELPSWDRFIIPRPFSRAVLVFGRPMTIPADLDEDKLEDYGKVLEEELERVSHEARRYVEGNP